MKNIRNLLVCKLGNLSGKIQNRPLYMQARRDWRKWQTTTDWEMADLIRKGIYITSLSCLGGHKTRSLNSPTRILSLYRGCNWVQSPLLSRWSQQPLSFQGCALENSFSHGNSGQKVHCKDWVKVRSLWLLWSSWRVKQWSCPLDELLQQK